MIRITAVTSSRRDNPSDLTKRLFQRLRDLDVAVAAEAA
jgi:hypothetical protein